MWRGVRGWGSTSSQVSEGQLLCLALEARGFAASFPSVAGSSEAVAPCLKDHLPYAALTRLKRDRLRLTREVRRRQRGSHIQPLQETYVAMQPRCLQK